MWLVQVVCDLDNTIVFNNLNGWTVYDDTYVREISEMNWQNSEIVAVSYLIIENYS